MGTKGVYTDAEARFWRRIKVDPDTGCWVWTGSRDTGGYGRIMAEGRLTSTHQWSYRRWVGPVPEGMDLDHLCRNRGCANWRHLEPVTRRENLRRGKTVNALNADKTHCAFGHPYDEANTYVRPDRGTRECRACAVQRVRMSGLRHEVERLRAENAALRAEVARLRLA